MVQIWKTDRNIYSGVLIMFIILCDQACGNTNLHKETFPFDKSKGLSKKASVLNTILTLVLLINAQTIITGIIM